MNRNVRRLSALVFVAAGFVSVGACSGDPPPASHTPVAGVGTTFPYAYKFFVQENGTRREVSVVPQEVANALHKASAAAGTTSTLGTGVRAQSGTVTPTSSGDSAYASFVTQNILLWGAASECGMINDPNKVLSTDPVLSTTPEYQDLIQQEANGQRITAEQPQIPFSRSTAYYIFPKYPTTCDEVLEDEETLVCVADKVAQLADAIAPMTWRSGLAGGASLESSPVTWNPAPPVSATNPPQTWILPPPAENEKFILRDLALSVLGQIPLLDAYPFLVRGTAPPPVTCSALYAAYDAQTTKSATYENLLFGASPIPAHTYPPTPDPSTGRTIAQEREAFEAGVLRASGQLLHDLVRESVYSDLAGAAAQAGAAADPTGGQSLAYGLNGSAPYNSLGHVARTLLGRLESEITTNPADPLSELFSTILDPDPACHGTAEVSLFSSLADPGTQARAKDLGATSATQAAAETLFEESGLVLADTSTADLGVALTTQLIGIKAATANTTAAAFATQPGGIALAQLVSTLSASDLARGAQHNRATFSMITDVATSDPTVLTAAATKYGLTVDTSIENDGIAGSGIAISSGLQRTAVSTDPVARTGAMMGASQCPMPGGLPALQLDEQTVAVPNPCPNGTCPAYPSPTVPFPGSFERQDVFALGQSIRARLVKLREHADGSANVTASSSVDAQARAGAVAEMGAWAGTGRAVLSTSAGDDSATSTSWPANVFLDLIGVAPADFGLTQLSDLKGAISLVVGDPSLAECAAHLSTRPCDAGALKAATMPAMGLTFDSFGAASPDQTTAGGQSALRVRYGLTGGYARLAFAAPPFGIAGSNTLAQPIFVVSAQDPTKGPGVGAVLGALELSVTNLIGAGKLSSTFGETSTALSPMRRELLEDAFGLGKWVGAAPPEAGELSAAATPSFCVEGVQRDIFVPLENDLTDDTDTYENSWSHYLTQAQTAAQRADDIGQTMVDVGLQIDTNIENAAVQLQTITGSPTNVGDLQIDANGVVTAGASNGSLGALLTQPTIDVVFFSSDPLKVIPANVTGGSTSGCVPTALTDKASFTTLSNALGCSSSSSSAGSSVNAACTKLAGATKVLAISPPCAATFATPPDPLVVTYTALNLAPALPPKSAQPCNPLVRAAAAMKGISPGGPGALATDPLGAPTYAASTPFNSASVATGLTTWTSTPPEVQDSMQRVQMTVADNGSWNVTYGGALVMDSTSTTAWPGCLSTSPGCDWTNPTTDALNDVLRACPPGVDLRSPLGQCDGGDPAFEVNSLRWRVEGVLWTAAMMAGYVPYGLITSPTPAANNAPGDIPISMYYLNGSFVAVDPTSPSSQAHLVGDADGAENDALDNSGGARLVPPDSPWYKWTSAGLSQLPPGLRAAYAPGATYGSPLVHVTGSTVSGQADFTAYASGFFSSQVTHAGLTDHIGRFEWGPLTGNLDGRQCPTPNGPPLGAPLNQTNLGGANWLQGLMAVVKSSYASKSQLFDVFEDNGKTGRVMSQLFEWSPWDGFSELPGSLIPSASVGTGFFSENLLLWHASQDKYQGVWPSNWATTAPQKADAWRSILQGFGTGDRARFSLNTSAPSGDCDAAWQLTQAIAMSCLFDSGIQPSLAPTSPVAPALNSLDDLANVNGWLRSNVNLAAQTLQNAYVERVPTLVVANAVGVPGSLSSVAGTSGTSVVQAANALLDVYAQWNLVLKDADAISSGVEETRNAIATAATEENMAIVNVSIQRLQTIKAIAQDVAQILKGVQGEIDGAYVDGAGDLAAGAVGLVTDGLTMPLLDQLDHDQHTLDSEKIQAALYSLHDSIVANSTAMTNALIVARQDANNVTAGSQQFASAQSEASYYAGKAVGADVWACAGANGATTECVSHVNTVLNRRYAGDEIRYQSALTEAKALGYIARRAIEQRIGVRLTDITTNIGPLDPPSTWADDVCHLTGINYKRLTAEVTDDAGIGAASSALDQQIAGEFADGFIGDYVQKLSDFVEYYDLAYPEADGNDTAVLSLRETLLGGKPGCLAPSPNLLSDPSRLFAARDSASTSVSGWTEDDCDPAAASCLQIKLGSGAGPVFSGGGAISWLSDVAQAAGGPGIDDADAGEDAGAGGGPANTVSQTVNLAVPGTYLLSWWDQARDPQTGQPSATAVPYRVGVYDSSWTLVAAFSGAPMQSDPSAATPTWSARRVVSFTVATPDLYHVAFAASPAGGAPGSVAIANPQLELSTSTGVPSPYVNRGAGDPVEAVNCPLAVDDLLASFIHTCDPDGTCHYDLKTPFTINTQTLTSNGLSLAGKIASGNYNFRHVDVALNVAGTGVIDCSQSASPDCQGSGYLSYTLTDDGTNVGVLGFDGQYRPFDFGSAVISQGKALTAERYITTPVSSTDQQLIAQVVKTELRGRPIDGTYGLRIYDSPALRFNQIQDIQLVLNYHYWSRISAPQNAN